MRVALVSTGLGRVLRGFESFTESLFQALRIYAPDIDVTLFQGGGTAGKRRVVVPNFHRYNAPAKWFNEVDASILEHRSFGLCLYPILRHGHCDVVHYNELAMGSALFHLRRRFGGGYKLLYCNGATWSPVHYHQRCDCAQLLSGPAYEEARDFGVPDERLFLVPYGLDDTLFSSRARLQRSETRRELGIPDDATVVVTAAILDRGTKRIDYLIRELSRLDQPVWLLAAGQRSAETPLLEQMADRLLPGRWTFVTWPPERVPFLYGSADVFVLTSLAEGFGRVTMEAILCGLPAITHNGPVFRWVAEGTPVQLIDMSADGELSRALRDQLLVRRYLGQNGSGAKRFTWKELMPDYIRMYERVAQSRQIHR